MLPTFYLLFHMDMVQLGLSPSLGIRYRPESGDWLMNWNATQIQSMNASLAILFEPFLSSGIAKLARSNSLVDFGYLAKSCFKKKKIHLNCIGKQN